MADAFVHVERRLDSVGDQAVAAQRGFTSMSAPLQQVNRGLSPAQQNNAKMFAYQLNQVAQQGAVTGNYMGALSIQAADMLAVFGLWGVLAGGVIAVMGPLAMSFFDAAEGGKELQDTIDDLDAAASSLTRSVSDIRTPLSDLTAEYGALTGRARELLDIQLQLDRAAAKMATARASRSLSEAFGAGNFAAIDPSAFALGAQSLDVYTSALEEQYIRLLEVNEASDGYTAAIHDRMAAIETELTQIKNLSANLDDLGAMLGVSADGARDVAAAMAALSNAEGPRAQADAMIILADEIERATNGFSDGDEEAFKLYQQLLDAASAALTVAANPEGIAGPIGDGADEADRLKTNLAAAAALFNEMSRRGALTYSGRGGDPRNFMAGGRQSGENYSASMDYIPIDEIIARYNRTSGGGGADPREREAERIMREVEQYTLDAMDATQRYKRELADLQELERAGYLTAEQYARAREMVTAQFEEEANAERISALTQGVQGFTDALFEGGEAVKDWARQTVAEIAKVIVQMMILRALGLPTDGVGGGSFAGWIGQAIFGGFRASGGPVSAGKAYIVGERGPEMIVPNAAGTVVPNDKLGRGNMTFNIDARGAEKGVGEEIAMSLRAEMRRLRADTPEIAIAAVRSDTRENPL
ncbi:hypothetical protein CDZ95_05825 [Mameliella alba]|nr:hypothetical protein CDZ95_05825 [Mameliella alba]